MTTTQSTVAPPKPAARKPAPAAPPAGPTPAAILTYLRLHALLIAFCGALVGAPAAYTAWSLVPPKYGSYALLQIESNPSAVGGGDPGRSGVTAFDTYVKTQKTLIRSVFNLNAALNHPDYGLSKLPTLAEQRDPIKFLEEKLIVDSTGSELLRIEFEGERPDDVRKIVDAVKAAYMKECVADDLKWQAARKQKIDEIKAHAATLLTDRNGPATTFSSPDGGVQQAGGLPRAVDSPAMRHALAGHKQSRLVKLIDERDTLPARLDALKVESADLAGRIESVRKAEVPKEIAEAVEADAKVSTLKQLADQARRHYLTRRGSHPNESSGYIQGLKAEADAAANAVVAARKELLDGFVARTKQIEIAGLAKQLKGVQQQIDALEKRKAELPQQIEAANRDLADSLPPEVVQTAGKKVGPDLLPTDLDKTTMAGMYARIAETQVRMDFEQKAPPRVRERQAASTPSLRDGKKQILAAVAAGLGGFALMAAGAVVVELRAKRACSLADVSNATLVPVVGVIPAIPAGDDPVGRAAAAEAMDKLRSRVTQGFLARGCSTLAVTSSLADEGKAVTAHGLANSLALAGFKTLLVDFDLRTPALHQLVGVPNQDGVCELLTGQTDTRRASFVLANGLHFVPAGSFSEDARAAAVGERLALLVRKLAEPFDCLILHGHALLAAAEAVEVARRADAVLVCGEYRTTRLPLLKRAVDRLAVMEVPHVGIVYLGATTHEALC